MLFDSFGLSANVCLFILQAPLFMLSAFILLPLRPNLLLVFYRQPCPSLVAPRAYSESAPDWADIKAAVTL